MLVFCMLTVDILDVLKNLWTEDNPSNSLLTSQEDEFQPILSSECACMSGVVHSVKHLVMSLPYDFIKLIHYLNRNLTFQMKVKGRKLKVLSNFNLVNKNVSTK